MSYVDETVSAIAFEKRLKRLAEAKIAYNKNQSANKEKRRFAAAYANGEVILNGR